MSDSDKAKAKVDQVKGKAKETVGHAVGNESLEAEGRADQAKGDARQAGEKVKDAVKDVFHSNKSDD
ncbi:CsbD family protein [Streptomyces sp. CBMA29]|uniref:CsbD family protein n=1 Tax=Streptomyces sp. CBMA29 TaxID=1896314 RepID=UPI001661E10A|nr:CsbD family protein [Streptomyces sp. CBMA29]MBD0739345.1 CsbD family protein [Streptomyces sp. CBMA29]